MNKTAKNTMIYLAGTVTMAGLGFLGTIILTRILSTQVYAMYGLFSSFCTTIAMFISFGYDSSYSRFYYKHGYSQIKFIIKCLLVPALLFVLLSFVLIEPSQKLINQVFESHFTPIALFLLLVYVFSFSLHRFTQLTSRMENRAFNYILSNIISKSGFLVFVVLSYLICGSVSFLIIILSFAISSLLSVIINLPIICKVSKTIAVATSGTTTLSDLTKYGFPYMVNEVLVLIIPLMEKMIVRDLAGWDVLSIYTSATVFQTLAVMVTNTIVNIWNPIVYKKCDDEKILQPILHDFGVISTALVAIGTAVCVFLRRWLVLLLGQDYRSVYIIAPAIFLGALLNLSATIYGSGINIKKKTFHYVVAPLLQIVFSVVLCYLTVPSLGLLGVGLSALISISIGRIYRMIVGMVLYSTGKKEYGAIAIHLVAIVVAVCSIFYTSVWADVLLGSGLLICVFLLLGKEIFRLIKISFPYLKKAKK